ncbi:Na/Pi cotransporter family protein [Alkalibaculum sp. M08DMB]|uniref:Na/Pi cotransporter family protein n=1 Tax=Alkalibaculum sporogenes TaxID=2655001 RepID=A0A6A7K997_9FIRM|nr:Na/Pi cotransporter family protein [Alkalibaculum sporogenes]MPW25925.1 Na/Pi cotransporter family protein [Alkalibaculum sporogenes]
MSVDMIIGLIGGLGLFIYGMHIMSDGLKAVAGDRMKRLLEILTNNRIMAIFVGTIVTVMVQSSSTTTVMIIGFVNAGLMNLFQAAGVIIGANIGTTITAQMIAFDVAHFAPIFIGVGVCMALFSKKKKNRQIGNIVLGFGILFMGISTMSDVLRPLRDHPVFIDVLVTFGKNPLLGLLAGLVITVMVQSSSATIGLLQAVAISGAFDNLTGANAIAIIIPMLLGMNIGTCVTAMLSSIGTSITAKKAALIHLFVNIFGALWVMVVLAMINIATNGNNPIYNFIVSISGYRIVDGQRVTDVTREIANFHTLFNIANMVVLLPILNPVVKFIDRILPEKINEEECKVKLDERMLENPSIAIGQVMIEVVRMGNLSIKNLKQSIDALLNKDEMLIEKVFVREKLINDFERDITQYLVLLSKGNLADKEHKNVMNLFHSIHDIERIGDHAENLAELAQYRIDNKVSFSNTAVDELKVMMNTVVEVTQDVINGLKNKDREIAIKCIKREEDIDNMELHLRHSHINRLNKEVCKPASGVIFLDIIGNLERVGDHATNIAEYILD